MDHVIDKLEHEAIDKDKNSEKINTERLKNDLILLKILLKQENCIKEQTS